MRFDKENLILFAPDHRSTDAIQPPFKPGDPIASFEITDMSTLKAKLRELADTFHDFNLMSWELLQKHLKREELYDHVSAFFLSDTSFFRRDFPEVRLLDNLETADYISKIGYTATVDSINPIAEKMADHLIDRSNSPTIKAKIVVEITVKGNTFTLTRYVVCFVKGMPVPGTEFLSALASVEHAENTLTVLNDIESYIDDQQAIAEDLAMESEAAEIEENAEAPIRNENISYKRPVLKLHVPQESPNLGREQQLEQYLQRLFHLCWSWAKEKIRYSEPFHTEESSLLYSVFPELAHLSNQEVIDKLGILESKVTSTVVRRRRYKSGSERIDFANSPAVVLEIKVLLITRTEVIPISKIVTCYLKGNTATKEISQSYSVEIPKSSREYIATLSAAASQLEEPPEAENQEPTHKQPLKIFQELAERVTINHQGFEQIELKNWTEVDELMKQALGEITQELTDALGMGHVEVVRNRRAALVLSSIEAAKSDNQENPSLVALKETIYRHIKGCTWTMKSSEHFVTKTHVEHEFEGKKFTTSRFAFSVIVEILSNGKFVGTIVRDFEISAAYDDIQEEWVVSITLVQSPEEILEEKNELRKDWKRKSYIGYRVEEANMRNYFQGPVSPYRS